MSELKARTARSIADEEEILELGADCPIEPAQVYLKSEADKVIAEKDAEIARLNAIRKVHVEAIDSMEAGLLQDDKAIRHHKYKRCLAMARWCMARYNEWAAYYPTTTTRKMKFLDKWQKRWLALAEKFKEAK